MLAAALEVSSTHVWMAVYTHVWMMVGALKAMDGGGGSQGGRAARG
jgi:hypothetical protein